MCPPQTSTLSFAPPIRPLSPAYLLPPSYINAARTVMTTRYARPEGPNYHLTLALSDDSVSYEFTPAAGGTARSSTGFVSVAQFVNVEGLAVALTRSPDGVVPTLLFKDFEGLVKSTLEGVLGEVERERKEGGRVEGGRGERVQRRPSPEGEWQVRKEGRRGESGL